MTGRVESKKKIAKCSAAFAMCLELHKKGFLDSNLLPTTLKSLPVMRNALLAVSEKKKCSYPMIIKPEFWKQGRGYIPLDLYLTFIDVDAGLDRPHQPLGILTRVPLPEFPPFPIHLADGRVSNVISELSATPYAISTRVLEIITKFTLHVYEHIYNKTYEYDVRKMSYWLVPLLSNILPQQSTFEESVDMLQMCKVFDQPSWQWTSKTPNDDILNRYIMDPMNGGRRFYSNCLATHLKPQDPVPEHIPRQNQKFMDSILDYSDSRWLRSRDIKRWNQDQPVLKVEKIPFRRNHLAHVEDREQEVLGSLNTVICPEPMRISNVSAQVFTKSYYFLITSRLKYHSS